MQTARIIGNNCKLQLKNKGITRETFAEAMGYSCFDVDKLCDGRLFTTDEDIEDIASFFETNKEQLCVDLGADKYVGDDFIHCMGQFKKAENQEKILDIFDMYCDIREVLEK